jgi:hypothetical protein
MRDKMIGLFLGLVIGIAAGAVGYWAFGIISASSPKTPSPNTVNIVSNDMTLVNYQFISDRNITMTFKNVNSTQANIALKNIYVKDHKGGECVWSFSSTPVLHYGQTQFFSVYLTTVSQTAPGSCGWYGPSGPGTGQFNFTRANPYDILAIHDHTPNAYSNWTVNY